MKATCELNSASQLRENSEHSKKRGTNQNWSLAVFKYMKGLILKLRHGCKVLNFQTNSKTTHSPKRLWQYVREAKASQTDQ